MDIIEFRATRKQCNDMGFFDFVLKGQRGFVYLNGSCYIIDGYSFPSQWKARFKSSHGHNGMTISSVEEKLFKCVNSGSPASEYGSEEFRTAYSDVGFQQWLIKCGTRKQIAIWLESQTGRRSYADENLRRIGLPPMTYDLLKEILICEVEKNKSKFFDTSSYKAAFEKAKNTKSEAVSSPVVDTI